MPLPRLRGTRVVAAASLAAVGLAVVACTPASVVGNDSTNGDGGGGGDAASSVELSLISWDGGDDNKALEDIITGFEAANPGITIETTFVPEDTYVTKLQTMLVAEPPDIAIGYGWDVNLGFTPLNDIVFDAYGVDLADYSAVVDSSCSWEGTVFCFGTTVGSMVTFYNKEIFDDKSLPYPDASTPMTFQEMADVATQATTSGSSVADTVFGADMSLLVAYMDPANYLDQTGRTVEITKPEFTDTVQIIADMVADGVSPSGGQLETLGGGAETAFLDGKLAMMISDNFTIDLIEEAGLDYGIAPTPIVPGADPWIVSWTNGFGIPRGAEHTEEAAKFLAYMAQEGQEIQAGYGLMPTSFDVASQWADTPEREQLVTVNTLIRPSVFNPNIWAWNGPVVDAITAVVDGTDVDKAMADAEPKAQQGNDTTWEQFDRTLDAAGLE